MAEVSLLSASRTSWEAHLEPLMDTLLVVLKCHMGKTCVLSCSTVPVASVHTLDLHVCILFMYVGSCSPELHVVIRRVLVKLADISCPLAMSVSR